MTDQEKQIRRFRRVADQRLTTAEFLLQHGFDLDAVYLAGYTVECALKALILRWTPRNAFQDMLVRLTEAGVKGHYYEYLKGILKQCRGGAGKSDQAILGPLASLMKDVASWSTDLRYQVGTVRPKEALVFVRAAKAIRDLCARG